MIRDFSKCGSNLERISFLKSKEAAACSLEELSSLCTVMSFSPRESMRKEELLATMISELELRMRQEGMGLYRSSRKLSEIDIAISKPEEHVKSGKRVLCYVNKAKLWYLLCPLFALFFFSIGWGNVLRLYEVALILFSICCILSEVHHKGTWWDPECMQSQDQIREGARARAGVFYVRPICLALPAVLVVLVLELPRFISYLN